MTSVMTDRRQGVMAEQMQRRGSRQSTILTEDTLGGPSGRLG